MLSFASPPLPLPFLVKKMYLFSAPMKPHSARDFLAGGSGGTVPPVGAVVAVPAPKTCWSVGAWTPMPPDKAAGAPTGGSKPPMREGGAEALLAGGSLEGKYLELGMDLRFPRPPPALIWCCFCGHEGRGRRSGK